MVCDIRRVLLTVVMTFAFIGAAIVSPQPSSAQAQSGLFLYRQITNIESSTTGSVGMPVLSADGLTAVFADAPGTGDPATPNRIYRIASDGSGLAEVDSYVPLCFCGAYVDISADGSTIVSSDSMQVRVTQGGNGTSILTLDSNELSSLRISAGGDQIAFLLGRDVGVPATSERLVRGVYMMNADGSNLRLVAGPDQISALLGITPDLVNMLRLQTQVVDISNDASRITFGSYAGPDMSIFSVNSDGSALTQLRGGIMYVQRVAISGDGATVAYDVTPPNGQLDEIGVIPYGGGQDHVLATLPSYGQGDPIQLTDDGSQLLVSPAALLIDTAAGTTELLSTPIEGLGGAHEAVIPDGLPRATMSADASIVLYAMRVVRCADCANLSEQLAVLTFGQNTFGAPTITNPSIDPGTISLDDLETTTTIAATVEATSGEILGVGFTAILPDGTIDGNFVGLLFDDGTNGDATPTDQTYMSANVPYVMRAPRDPGPREIRIAAEVETADGYRYGTAIDAGILDVTSDAATRSG